MNNITDNAANFHVLTPDEAKLIEGGKPSLSTGFVYDVFYYTSLFLRRSEILTAKFWVEWDEAVS